jgi:acyl-CoA synthetase (AMP-forming)/AMP-acid ligase II
MPIVHAEEDEMTTLSLKTAPNPSAALPSRISHALNPHAEGRPHHAALVSGARTVAYGELATLVSETAQHLAVLGVRPGDRVMILGDNCVSVAVLVLAVSEIDAWSVVVHPRLAAPEVDRIREHSGCRIALYDVRPSALAEAHARRHGAKTRAVGSLDYLAVGALHPDALPEPVHPASDRQVAVLMYTSGTTGEPKGVMLSHRNLLTSAARYVEGRRITPADCVYGMTSIAHISGLSLTLIGSLLAGATAYLAPPFSPDTLVSAIEDDGITMTLGVPTMYRRLMEHKVSVGITRLPTGKLRLLGVVGAPLDAALKEAVEAEFSVPMINSYGLTETAPGVASVPLAMPRRDTSVGFVLSGVEARIVDKAGVPVPLGDVGEFHVRGPNVMLGYYRNAAATAAALDEDGWFNTGDLVKSALDGALFIVGRTKEIIIHTALNVYPGEVEAVLEGHPAVAESAVVGRKSAQDEDVIAFVKLRPGASATADEILAHAATELADYKRPSTLHIVSSMPLNAVGKIVKARLSEMLASSPDE